MAQDARLRMQSIKACLFDFGGTLDADGATWQDRFYPLYKSHGIEVAREVFREAFFYADDTLIAQRLLIGAGLYETLESQVTLVLRHLGKNGNKTRDSIVRSFLNEMERTVERNRGLLERLSRRFRLGIVSNFYGNLEQVLEDLALAQFFEVVIDSTHEGVLKPHPRMFQAALDRLGIGPDEGIFIGDNKARDMEGAKAIGMPHIWLVSPETQPIDPCCPGDFVISSLLDLEPLLLGLRTQPVAGDQM